MYQKEIGKSELNIKAVERAKKKVKDSVQKSYPFNTYVETIAILVNIVKRKSVKKETQCMQLSASRVVPVVWLRVYWTDMPHF